MLRVELRKNKERAKHDDDGSPNANNKDDQRPYGSSLNNWHESHSSGNAGVGANWPVYDPCSERVIRTCRSTNLVNSMQEHDVRQYVDFCFARAVSEAD